MEAREDSKNITLYKSVDRAPLMFRLARGMSRSHIRGAGVLTRLLRRWGFLNVVVQCQLNHIRFKLPLYRVPWDCKDLTTYEEAFVGEFSRALSPLRQATLLDCGADIGTFSALLCSRTDHIGRIIAFEPNLAACEFLRSNLAAIGLQSEVIANAISDFQGRGKLDRPAYDSSDHARFLSPGDGPVRVTTIDGLRLDGSDLAIKLDLEGGELNALQGGHRTIAAARNCVIGLEASPVVKERTGRDPVECLAFLVSIRPFEFIVAETGARLDITRPVLAGGQKQIWNIVGRSYANIS